MKFLKMLKINGPKLGFVIKEALKLEKLYKTFS